MTRVCTKRKICKKRFFYCEKCDETREELPFFEDCLCKCGNVCLVVFKDQQEVKDET